jgi:FkbM family methyltransferase
MSKARLALGLFGAAPLARWPGLAWYFFGWLAHRAAGVKLFDEQTLVFKPFRVSATADGLGGLVFLHEILARGIYDFEPLRNDPNIKVIFDAGANCGFFALTQAAASPRFHIVCFEPHPATYHRLEKNIALNALENRVTPVHAAVGAASGVCELNVSAESSMGIVRTSSTQFLVAPKAVQVPLIALDDYAEKNNLWPDFLKIDVEGFEVEVLRGARRSLERARHVVLEHHAPELLAGCTALLQEAGFETTAAANHLLIARKPARA